MYVINFSHVGGPENLRNLKHSSNLISAEIRNSSIGNKMQS